MVGDFARANDSQGAGDGVEVGILKNVDAVTPLFSATIGANHAVNPDAPFAGTGAVHFDTEVALAAGEALRFAAYPGPPGSTNIAYDGTALRVSIYRSAECADALDNDGDGLVDYPADRGCRSGDDLTETAWATRRLLWQGAPGPEGHRCRSTKERPARRSSRSG